MSSPSTAPASTAAPAATPIEKLLVLDEVISHRFGMAISSYPRALIERLLEVLPEPAVVRSGGADALLRQHLSIGETHFLRHRDQFDLLSAVVGELPGLARRGSLKVWSAACSTGEEVWTLAATLRAHPKLGGRFEIFGSDFNAESVKKAEVGVYKSWSLRGVQTEEVAEWLWSAGDSYRVDPELRRHVRFAVANLMDRPYPGDQDVIFCRNVLIYFRPDAVRRVYEGLAAALAPGGVLFVASTDPQPEPGCGLDVVDCGGARYFRRSVDAPSLSPSRVVEPTTGPTARAAAPAAPAALGQPAAAARPSTFARETPSALSSTSSTATAARWSQLRQAVVGGEERAPRPAREPAAASTRSSNPSPPPATPLNRAEGDPGLGDDRPDTVELVRSLMGSGKAQEAVAVLSDLVEADPMNAELRCLATFAAVTAGMNELAALHARHALFLQPEGPVPNLLVGALMLRQGQRSPYAQQRLVRARLALEGLPPGRAVGCAAGRTVDALLRFVRDPHASDLFAIG